MHIKYKGLSLDFPLKSILFKISFFFVAIVLFLGSFFETEYRFPANPYISSDKAKHIIGAFVLIVLFRLAFRNILLFWTYVILLMGSVGIEVLQHFSNVGQREFDLKDIFANVIGFSAGLVFILVMEYFTEYVIKKRKEIVS